MRQTKALDFQPVAAASRIQSRDLGRWPTGFGRPSRLGGKSGDQTILAQGTPIG